MSLYYEPNKTKLDRLIDDATLSSGATILIPNLQRAYVWQPDQVILLIDSLIKGWPFGSLLLWSVEPACMPDISVPPMPKRSLWSLVSSVETSRGLPEAKEPTPYRMVLDGQQRLQSLVLALKGMAYGFQLFDHEWARALELPTRKETPHWSRGCLCVDLPALADEMNKHQGVIEWVDFKHVLIWATIDSSHDQSPGRTAQQRSPLHAFRHGEPVIPLAKFWEKAVVTHVRQPGKFDTAMNGIFAEYRLAEPEAYRQIVESLLDKLSELKATDVHYLEVLPFTPAFNLDQYNDAVINIFTRLNSAGRALLPEEITFAWIKMNWQSGAANGSRPADQCFHELAEQLEGAANLNLDINELVRGISAVWATLFSNGALLTSKDLLKAEKLKPMASELSGCWNSVAGAIQTMSTRISALGFKFRETYHSLNALFVLWGLESVVATWAGRTHLRTLDADAFDRNYESLLEKSIDRWFLLSQWAGIWSQASDTDFALYLKAITDLKMTLAGSTDGDQAIEVISRLINQWLDSFKAPAKQYIENLNANSRASVRQYYGPLWIWNRLQRERWEIAKIHLREFHRKKSKLLETDVDHVIAIKLWETKTEGMLPPEEVARTVNSIGNCCLLEKTFNVSKSDKPAYDFFAMVNEFREDRDKQFLSLVRSFRLPGSLLRPFSRDKERLARLIALREKRIKAELTDYVDGRVVRVDI